MELDDLPRPYYNPEGALIFLHIPKTAGMSFQRLLDAHFDEECTYRIDPYRFAESAEEFRKLPESTRSRIVLLCGHQSFGLHEWIPGLSTYVGFFRDPVERVLSFYSFAKERPEHPLHEEIQRDRLTIEDLLTGDHATQVVNLQTRLVLGRSLEDPEEALTWAKHHMRFHFCAIGLTERFAESVALIRNVIGLADATLPTINTTRERVREDELPQSTRDLVREKNQLDLELYRFATEMFDIQVTQQGPAFPGEVQGLAANAASDPKSVIGRLLQRFPFGKGK